MGSAKHFSLHDTFICVKRPLLAIITLSWLALLALQVQAMPTSALQSTTSVGISPSPQASPSSVGVVGSNVGIVGEALPDRQQVEVTIAVDPRNPNVLVAGGQDLRLKSIGEHRWHGYYRSTDNGQTWSSSLLPGFPSDTSPQGLSSPLHKSNVTSDPVLAFDRAGNVYYAGLVFNLTSTGSVGNTVAFVAKYVNDGLTYSGVTLITGPLSADKEWIAVDTTGGPNDGNVYMAFDAQLTVASPFATLFTRSTDGGSTFSAPFYAPADQTGGLPGVAVDLSGNVYVSSDAFDPVTGANLYYVQVSKLVNGGASVVQTVRAVNPASWLTGPPSGASFRAFTIPQIAADNKGVYVIFDDLRQGNASVFLTRSTDGGSSWTAPLRVNDVSQGQHFFPTIAVSAGIINVAWYDSRLNTGATMTTLDLFYAQSQDGGVSFSPNVRVTNASFNPNTVLRTDNPDASGAFMGDYIGIAATAQTVHPIWTDNRSACDTVDPAWGCVDQDAYTATIGLADFAISASPVSQTVVQGGSGQSKITLVSLTGFSGSVSVLSSPRPSGLPTSPMSTTVNLPPLVNGFNLTFSPTATTPLGTYIVNVTGTSGARSHFDLLSITVQSPSVGGVIVPTDKVRLLLPYLAGLSLIVAAFKAVETYSHMRKARLDDWDATDFDKTATTGLPSEEEKRSLRLAQTENPEN